MHCPPQLWLLARISAWNFEIFVPLKIPHRVPHKKPLHTRQLMIPLPQPPHQRSSRSVKPWQSIDKRSTPPKCSTQNNRLRKHRKSKENGTRVEGIQESAHPEAGESVRERAQQGSGRTDLAVCPEKIRERVCVFSDNNVSGVRGLRRSSSVEQGAAEEGLKVNRIEFPRKARDTRPRGVRKQRRCRGSTRGSHKIS